MTIDPGGPVTDILDRQEERQHLLDLIASGRDVLVYGPRRMGKTSLLLHVAKSLEQERLVFQVDCTRKETDDEVAQVLLAQLSGLHGRWQRFWDWVKEHLEATHARIIWGRSPRIEVDPSGRSGRSIPDAVELVARVAEAAGTKALVILDEWQTALGRSMDSLSWQMRAVSQAHPALQLVFSGSEPSMLRAMLDAKNKAYFRGLVELPIQGIGIRDVLEDLPKYRIDLTPGAIEVLEDACGWTTLRLMEVLHQLEGKGRATKADALAAIHATLRIHGPDFERELGHAKPGPQRRILLGLARDRPDHPTGHEFLQRHGIKTAATGHGAIRRLRQLDLLDEDGEFTDALFRWYLANDPDLPRGP